MLERSESKDDGVDTVLGGVSPERLQPSDSNQPPNTGEVQESNGIKISAFAQAHSTVAGTIKKLQESCPPHSSMSAQDTAINEVKEAMRCLRICPRKVLGSLGHLRVEKGRIRPLEDKSAKAGGKADVEAAILVPAESSNAPGSKDPEYVAIKKLRFDNDTDDDRTLAPFAHEVKLLNDLSHPSVVRIVGFVEDAEQSIAWIVFSWEKNGNLREFIQSADWELPERVSLINDIAKGLSHLHGRTPPICHGDLKSLNILVNSENQAIITDFGSARTVDSETRAAFRSPGAAAVINILATTANTMGPLKAELAESGDFITMTGPAWTIRWAAPELLEGKLPDLASDIWAFGWICWEAVTGNFPFGEENELAIVLRILRGDLPAVGDNTQLKQVKALCSLMGQCWSLNANERPTAIRCKQIISFMDQVIPLSIDVNGLGTTRSSGLLCALGWIQMQNGMISEAEKYFQESFVVAESVGDKQGRARALNALGDLYHMRCEYSKAEETYIQARDAYSQIGNQACLASSIRGLGDVYHVQGEYSKAKELYIQARDICSQIGNLEGFANSVSHLGDVYRMHMEYVKAEELYIQARNTYSEIGHQAGFASSVRGLGDVYHMRGEHSKAKKLYIQARDIYSEVGSQLGFANSIQGLGRAFSALRQYTEAETSYLEAQAIYRQIGDMQSLANNLWYLGWLRRRQAQYREAEHLVCEASVLYDKLGMERDVGDCNKFLKWVRRLITAGHQ